MKRIILVLALVVLLPAMTSAAIWGPDFVTSTSVAARYVAKMTCSCVYVTGRDLEQCLGDLPAAAADLSVTANRETQEVTASVLWFEAVARYREARGCKLPG